MNYVHITGFARAGTTLLKNLFVCFKNTYITAGEVSRIGFSYPRAAHGRVVVTKHPNDIERPELLMAQLDTHHIFLIRDPRDRACSSTGDVRGDQGRSLSVIRKANESDYYRIRMEFLEKFRDQVLIVKYEDVIQQPDETQQRLADYCSLEIDIPFAEGWSRFSENENENHLQKVMNGLRPLDARTIGRWQTGEFQGAIQEYLRKHPQVRSFIKEFYPEPGCENPQREV